MEFEYGQDKRKRWRWRLRANDGRIIVAESKGYRHEDDCLEAIALVRSARHAPSVQVDWV